MKRIVGKTEKNPFLGGWMLRSETNMLAGGIGLEA
jgi:hypothetical protein